MLKLAIQSRFPLIAATTSDILNVREVIRELTGFNLIAFKSSLPVEQGKIYYKIIKPTSLYDWEAVYNVMRKNDSCLLIINPKTQNDLMFHAGEIPVPQKLMLRFIAKMLNDRDLAETLITALGGCTLKTAEEFIRLTIERDGAASPHGLAQTRRANFQDANGLTYVPTSQPYYQADQALQDWVETEREFFFNAPDPRLHPRGLLFDVEFVHLTKQQCGMFKHFRDKCPKGEAAKVLDWTLEHWVKFVKTVESRMGIKNMPAYPKVDFLLKYTEIAVDLQKKDKSWKKELASAQLSDKLDSNLQSIASNNLEDTLENPRRRSSKQPKSYDELMSIIGSGNEQKL